MHSPLWLRLLALAGALTLTAPLNAETASGAAAGRLPLAELRTFTEVFSRIKEAYVEEVDDARLLENAIKGMLNGLDPHSAYMDPEAFRGLKVHTRGEFGGLGIEVTLEEGVIRVIAPIDDTPASRAGIRAGDRIIKLDDTPVRGMELMDAIKRMRGKPGTEIELTLTREGASQPFAVTLTRDLIKVASVRSRLLEDQFGYLRISQFQLNSGEDLVAAMERLDKDQRLRGYILDLRNNPGGVLQAAVDVSDAFLEDGRIVYTQGRIDQAELSFSAEPGDPSRQLPLVVLINGGSASASEIVAGALQDQQRAVILGTRSFGKGSVQTILPLENERALKLTTARYYTPSGRSIQAEGIVPDIEVTPARLTRVETQGQVKEADLEGHLGQELPAGHAPASAAGESREDAANAELLANDYQLNEALNLLKGLAILGRSHD